MVEINTSIAVSKDTLKSLNTLKYSMECVTIDEVINRLIKGYNPTEDEQDGEDDSGDKEDTV